MRVCWSTRKGQRALIISPPFDSFLYSVVKSPCYGFAFSLCIALTIRSSPVRMIERGIARFRRI